MSWKFTMGHVKHIHFVGVGGVGMAGIAEVLLSEGYQISGSDLSDTALTQRLLRLGAVIYLGHDASHIKDADVVVKSSAIADDNVELQAAIENHLPIVARAEMLGELMRFRYGIAIAGTHGKTTTTSLTTCILAEAGVDPTFVIGGKLNSSQSNARLGSGHYLVAEADESDASFLFLQPMISVITNIDADHMSTYNNNFDQLRQTFLDFLHRLPFYGLGILCIDDLVVKEMLPLIARPFMTYGFCEQADCRATDIRQTGLQTTFVVTRKSLPPIQVKLNLPGRHNVLNALAAITIATELNIADEFIIRALANFAGIGRRFQVYGDFYLSPQSGQITLVDDYGHHPREIAATLQAARDSWPSRRIVMVYQPHRYSRTRDLLNDFVEILNMTDALVLLQVYSAGEAVIPGADSAALSELIRDKGKMNPVLVTNHLLLNESLQTLLRDGDVLIMQGAGNIGKLAAEIATSKLSASFLTKTVA